MGEGERKEHWQKQKKDVRMGSASGPEAMEQEADSGRKGKRKWGWGACFQRFQHQQEACAERMVQNLFTGSK